jgi:hypothetical protein
LSATPYCQLPQFIAAAHGTVPLAAFEQVFHGSLDAKTAAFLLAHERFGRYRREESDLARLTRQVETFVSRYQPGRAPSPMDLLSVAPSPSPDDEGFIHALEEAGSVTAYAQQTGEPYKDVLRKVKALEERTGMKRGKDFLGTRKRRAR